MQSLSQIATNSQEGFATNGKKASANATYGADFAAMLGNLTSKQDNSVNNIFSAMQQYRKEQGAVNGSTGTKNTKDNHAKNNKSSFSAKDLANDVNSSSKTSTNKNTSSEQVEKHDEEPAKASEQRDDTVAWFNALMSDDGQSVYLDDQALAKQNTALDEQSANNTSKSNTKSLLNNLKNSDLSELKTQDESDLQNFAQTLLEGDENLNANNNTIKNEDASLAYLMAQSGVKAVKVSEIKGDNSSSLAQESMDDLSFISDSLQASAELSEENMTSEEGFNENAQNQNMPSENKSLSEALATLKQGTGKSEGVDVAESTEQNSIDEVTGAAQGLSNTRVALKDMQKSNLRSDMLTLSQDVKKNAEEIAKAVMSMAARNLKRFTFELNPQGMGHMEISVDTDQSNEAVNVSVAAEDQVTRRLIAQSLPSLKQILHDAGVNAETSTGDYQGGDGHEHRSAPDQEQHHDTEHILVSNDDLKEQDDQNLVLEDDVLSLFA